MGFEITFNDVVTLISVIVAAVSIVVTYLAKKKELSNAKASAIYHEKVNVYSEFIQIISASVFVERMVILLNDATKLLKLTEKILLLIDEDNQSLFVALEPKLKQYFNLSFEYQKFIDIKCNPPVDTASKMKDILNDINKQMPAILSALRADLNFK